MSRKVEPTDFILLQLYQRTQLSQATHIAQSSAAVTAIFPQLPV